MWWQFKPIKFSQVHWFLILQRHFSALSHVSMWESVYVELQDALESKSRCDCWNMKWFQADAKAYRHSVKTHPAASQLAGSSGTANLRDFKPPLHTHNSEFQRNSWILVLYTRVEGAQHNKTQKNTSFECSGLGYHFKANRFEDSLLNLEPFQPNRF